MSAAAALVYRFFLLATDDVAYAQLAVTYTLVIAGLILIIFLRPPRPRKAGGERRSGDWRPTAMVLVLLILIFVAASIPLAYDLFGLKPLQQPRDYLIVGLAVVAWAIAANVLWWMTSQKRLWQRFRG